LHSRILNDEKNLLEQIAQGDEAAFSTLFYAYLDILQTFIMKLTRSATDTEEVVQETFMRLWMGRDKLTEVRSLHAWIYTIAANECYKFLKKRSSREQGLAPIDNLGEADRGDDAVVEGLDLKEVHQLVIQAVGRLPAQRRRIYQMSRDEGMKIAEIAEQLGISPNTVKNTLVMSLGFIRKYLAERGHEV
jgi:RNA polymerase sigma-70 factor (ECF subfamily)